MNDKSYQKKPAKSMEKQRKEAAQKAVAAREKRRKKAIESIAIGELVKRLPIYNNGEIRCPYCDSVDSLKLNEKKFTFSCTSCKTKGNSATLVKKSLDTTLWKAISYLEELRVNEFLPANAKESSSSQKKQTSKKKSPAKSSAKKPAQKDLLKERVSQVKSANDIEVVITNLANVSFKKVGSNMVCRCPFVDHEDKTPSFTLKKEKQSYRCYGCNRSGDVISFVQEFMSCSFKEAVDYLDNNNSSQKTVPPIKPVKSIEVTEKQTSKIEKIGLVQRCQEYFQRCFENSVEVKKFLHDRGIASSELVSHFKIGFDDGSINKTLSKEIKPILSNSGFINEKGNSRFYRCLTVGLEDRDGNITSIYGRRIAGKGAKHQFPKGNVKSIFNAKAFHTSREIIITEGVLDSLALWYMGWRNTSCIFSASIIPPLIPELIACYRIKKILLAFDNDQRGDEACALFAKSVDCLDVEIKRIEFPDNIKDANELLLKFGKQKATNVFSELIKEAKPLFITLGKSNSTNEKFPPLDIPVNIKKEEIEFVFGERNYRVRGLYKNHSFDSLRVNLRVVMCSRLHVDSLDLYNARQRGLFIKTAADELELNNDIIKTDIGKILLKLEEIQAKQIEAATKPQEKEIVLSEEEREVALSFLKSENLLEIIKQDFRRYGLVGEDANILVIYLALTSRKLEDPLAIIIQSMSGAGKTTLMDTALMFMPEEDVIKFSAMTGQSLYYLGEKDLVHKILAIAEEQGAEKATYALKLLQSEKNLSIASTGKDTKSGKFTTHEYRVEGPVQTTFSTTSSEIDEELQNRCLILSINEYREQTKAIHDKQREKETLEGMLQYQEKKYITTLHQNAQRLLEPITVVNPYATKLTFIDTRLRTRRDHVKYLALIRTIALLHQYQRPKKTIEHRGKHIKYIEVIPEDIAVANELVADIMGQSLDELSPQTRRFLGILLKMVTEHCEEQHIDFCEYHFTRRDAREYSNWSDFQVRTHLSRLVEMEYVILVSGNRGTRQSYELLYNGQGENNKNFILGLIDPQSLKNQQGEHRKLKGVH